MKIKNEIDLINHIKRTIKLDSCNVVKSIGDDCAVIKPTNKHLIITTDTSLEGPHFTNDYTSEEIGYKSLATNLSDIAAMGGNPKYVLMSLTLPRLSTRWLKGFYKGMNVLMKRYNLCLIGGDTNKGQKSITIQVIGESKNKIMYRYGAKVNDDIYVSGKLGLARAALIIKKMRNKILPSHLKRFLHKPVPRVELGLAISKYASSCIDVSDGLSKDLKLICEASNVGADIYLNQIPTSKKIISLIGHNRQYEAIIGGGEDYELCFTSNNKNRTNIKKISTKLMLPLTIIGKVTKKDINYYSENKIIKLNIKGFDHFQ